MGVFTFVDFLVIWLVVVPTFAFLHELGHASMVLLLTGQRATIQLGRRGLRCRLQLGRLRMILNLGPGAAFSRCLLEDLSEISLSRRVWFFLGGPIASLLLSLLFGGLALSSTGSGPWLITLAMIPLFQFLLTILPWRYPPGIGVMGGMPSDGLYVVRLIRHARKLL